MKRSALSATLAVLVLAPVAAGLSADLGSSFGSSGVVEVQELVVSLTPGAGATIKTHLVTGVTVEFETRDRQVIDDLLAISQAFAMPRARLAVTLQGGEPKVFHLATGAGRPASGR